MTLLIDKLARRMVERHPQIEDQIAETEGLTENGATATDAMRASLDFVLTELDAMGYKVLEPETASVLAERAYGAFSNASGGTTTTGEQMPPWGALPSITRFAWVAAVASVRKSVAVVK